MEKKSVSDNDISMKKGILELDTTYQALKSEIGSQIQRIKHKKVKFGVRYDVSSIKKRNLELDTMYQAQKKEFWSQIQCIKR